MSRQSKFHDITVEKPSSLEITVEKTPTTNDMSELLVPTEFDSNHDHLPT